MTRRQILARYGDTPEIEALSTGLAREAHFARGYGEARAFGNKLAMRATAVPEGKKAQIAYLAGRYGTYGREAGQFLQSISGVKLQAELGITSPHFLNKAFDANIRPSPNGFQQSNINGLDVLKAYKHPNPALVGRPAMSAAGRPMTYGTSSPAALVATAPISPAALVATTPPISPAVRAATVGVSTRGAKAMKSAQVSAALDAHRTRSATHRALMDERGLASATRLAMLPIYKSKKDDEEIYALFTRY